MDHHKNIIRDSKLLAFRPIHGASRHPDENAEDVPLLRGSSLRVALVASAVVVVEIGWLVFLSIIVVTFDPL